MRLVALGLALALAAIPAAAQAQAPLAPGEVLLELGSMGTATVPANLATLTVHIGARGETEAAVRVELDARYRRVVAAARQAGVPAAAITEGARSQIADMRTFDVMETPPPSEGAAAPPPPPSHFASRSAIVRVTDMARVDAIRAALIAAADTEPSDAVPAYSLTDSRAARQTARTQALAAVRADAEAYAASLGMRVVRIVRVSERTGVGLLPHLLGDPSIPRRLFGPEENRDPNVTVLAVVGVDFALAPR